MLPVDIIRYSFVKNLYHQRKQGQLLQTDTIYIPLNLSIKPPQKHYSLPINFFTKVFFLLVDFLPGSNFCLLRLLIGNNIINLLTIIKSFNYNQSRSDIYDKTFQQNQT